MRSSYHLDLGSRRCSDLNYRTLYKSPDFLLTSLINALQEEYEYVKKRGSLLTIRLFEGECVSSRSDGYIYKFRMGRFLSHISPDTTVHLKDFHGNVIEGEILSVGGDTITLYLKDKPASSEVEMMVDPLFLILEQLRKLEIYKDNCDERLSRTPLHVFLYAPVLERDGMQLPEKRLLEGLNDDQVKALHDVMKYNVSIIWGPPGTGKTKLLATLAILAAQSGKKVLVITYTHESLDKILSLIDSILRKNSAYLGDNKPLIVRLGNSPDAEIVKRFGEERAALSVLERLARKDLEEIKRLEELLLLLNERLKNVAEHVLAVYQELLRMENSVIELKNEIAKCRLEEERLSEKYLKLRREYWRLQRSKPPLLLRIFDRDWRLKMEWALRGLGGELRRIEERLTKLRKGADAYLEKVRELGRFRGPMLRMIAPVNMDCLKFFEEYLKERGYNKPSSDLRRAIIEVSKNSSWLYEFYKYGGEGGVRKRIAECRKQIKQSSEELKDLVRRRANVIACTLAKSITELFDQVFMGLLERFDLALIYEANRARLDQIWIVSSLADNVAIFGDPKQLPPITLLEESSEYWKLLSTDIFTWTGVDFEGRSPIPNTLLSKQYKMGRKICDLMSTLFYGDRLTPQVEYEGEIFFYDTAKLGARDEKTLSKSKVNILNVFVVLKILREVLEKGFSQDEIAVVTPYIDQCHAIMNVLEENGLNGVAVRTMHTFQGEEKRIVVIDLVCHSAKSFSRSPLCMKRGWRLMATAISKAMDGLYIIGPYQEVKESRIPVLTRLLEYIPRECVRNILLQDILPFKPEIVQVSSQEQFFLLVNNAYSRIFEDLEKAERYVIVISPSARLDILEEFAKKTRAPLTVYTRLQSGFVEARRIPNMNLVNLEERIDLNAIIIDDHVLYEGPPNFLNPISSLEVVTRYDSYRNPKLWRLKEMFPPQAFLPFLLSAT